jgi:dihydrofolate reductase
MRLSLIVAMGRNGVIGANGALPWRLPADLMHFRDVTIGKPIVMGRRTHESIGRPLPGRENIVISRNPGFHAPGCTVLNSLDAAWKHCAAQDEVFVMGGAELYRQTLDRADRIHLTEVHADVEGDTRFPPWDRKAWREIERRDFGSDEKNPHRYSFVILERV